MRQQAFFGQQTADGLPESGPGIGRFGFQFSVKWKAAVQGMDLHEPGIFGAWKERHGGQRNLPGLFAAEVLEQAFVFRRECLLRLEHKVGAQQCLGLFLDGLFQIGAQRADRRQRGDAQND